MADNLSNDVPRRIDFQTVPAEPFEKDGELFMKFQFIPSPNRYERRIKFRSKQGIMSQENNNTSNRGLASADEETKESVAKAGGEARA